MPKLYPFILKCAHKASKVLSTVFSISFSIWPVLEIRIDWCILPINILSHRLHWITVPLMPQDMERHKRCLPHGYTHIKCNERPGTWQTDSPFLLMSSHTPLLDVTHPSDQYYFYFLHESFSVLIPWEENQAQLFVGNISVSCAGNNSVSKNCMQPLMTPEEGSDDPGKSSYHHAKYSQCQVPTPLGSNGSPKSPGLKQGS